MAWVLLLLFGITLCFGLVVLFGAPYLPTLKRQTEDALDLINLEEGRTLLELGAGDGRVMRAAARRGFNVIGIELNPLLCVVAYIVTWRYRKQVRIICGDMWRVQWPPTDGIFVFLLDRFMPRMDKKIIQSYSQKVKVVSYTFKIPGRQPVRIKGPLYLYAYLGNEKSPSLTTAEAGRSGADAVA